MDEGDVAVVGPNKSEVAALVTELTPNTDITYESKRQSSEISDPISVDLEHGDSQEDLMMIDSPITEPVRASPPLLPRSRVNSDSVYLLEHNMAASHFPMIMNHYHPVPVLMPHMGPVQTEAMPTDGHGINDMDNINSHHSGSSPTNNLSAMIQHQIEYYFSRDNLQNDSYLLSQMDEDQFVAIQTVAGFNQIKKLTIDTKLIVEAIKNSPLLQIDDTGTKVRANVVRSVIILREIPASTSVEDVKNLFNSRNCPKFVNCEFAHNDSWYVSFDTETEAQEAYRYLREEVKEFLGKPIYARIKGKTLQRPTYPKSSKSSTSHSQPRQQQQQQPQPQQQAVFPFPPPLQPPIAIYPTLPWPPQPFFEHPSIPYMVNGYPTGYHHHSSAAGHYNRQPVSSNHRNRGGGSRSYSLGDQPTAPVMQQQHNSHNGNSSHSTQSLPPRYNRARDNNDDSGRKGPRMRNSRRRDDYPDKPPRQQNKHLQKIDLEPSQFPPLVSQPTSNGSASQNSSQGNVSEDGYAQAASVKGKRVTPPTVTTATSSTSTAGGVTVTTPVSNDKLTSTSKSAAVTTSSMATVTTQLAASSNNAAEVKSAPVPTPPPATPPKSTQKVTSTAAAKIGKQEPSKPAAAKPSRLDKDSTNIRNSVKAKSSDNSKSSHHNSKVTRRDKKKSESKSSSSQNPTKSSPQMEKKQLIPLPPSPPAVTNMIDKLDIKEDASKPEKMSYALVAQKAKSKIGETASQPGSPPGETSNEQATSQPSSPSKSEDTVPT